MWIAGSSALASAASSACEVTGVAPGEWRARLEGEPPHLLLVEAGERRDEAWDGELEAMLDACEAAGVPRVLWATASPFDRGWLDYANRFERAFAIDPQRLVDLDRAGFEDPTVLWPATAIPIRSHAVEGTASRPYRVAWLGGWRHDWPRAWRERLASILRAAAPHGLHIAGMANVDALPADLRPYVDRAGVGSPEQVLRRARVVIAADPAVASLSVAPGVAFDAVACGAAGVTPHEALRTARKIGPVVLDGEQAAKAIARLLEDDALREESVAQDRRIVACNHTYPHRLATIASTVGYQLVPDVPARTAPR